ncbi:BspA family leucine-rich repeat surface protein, partial [uncultured Robinsoniella sp.]|uniref:BspA family leucine-rich repeat surface protein n=1 Tax=uncultured Robinsoniella sp. TaxID=904190 RepID=UPI00374EE18F
EVGDHVLRINVATKDGAKTAFVEKRLRVEASSYTPLKPVQDASLIAWFDAAGRTNQDINKTEWTDKSGNGVKASLVNFNYGGNGWIEGALKCNGNSYVEIDLRPFADDVPNGLTIDIKFKTRDTGEENACVLDIRDTGTNQKGFAIDTKNIYLNSGSTKLKSAILNDEMSKASFVIDRENKISYIYNNAVMTEAFLMSSTEDFYNTGKIYLNTTLSMSNGVPTPTLFGDCEIYSIRVYERALSSSEIVQNHIADITDLGEQEEKYRLNYDNMMPTMYFYGDTSAMTKDTKVPLRIKYISTDSNKYGESFDLTDCPVGWQGTSSLQYAVKNYKIKLVNQDGSKFKYTPFPNGIPESTYCLKADYMESSHANNTGMCKFINDRLYDTKTPPQQADPKVRTTINGFPIQLYIAKDDQSTPVYMGVFNFNLDKGCNKSFGLDNEAAGQENCLRFEVSSNSDTSAGAFKDDSDASIREDFELNYPDPDDFPGVVDGAYANLKRMITWVKNSTEESFANEVEQYFNKEYLLKYYLQVHLFGMVDNLGKNMMLCTWGGNIWYPTFYDADSQLALDNTGYLKFFSDIDIVEGVYNTSGSKLWTMVSKVFASELSEMYKAMRQTVYKMDVIMSYWYGEQVAKIGELQYNKDMEAKYIQFKNDYLFMLHGRRYENTKMWLTERILYLDTIYGYEEDTKQSITIRANKSGSVYLNIEAYSPQYLRVVWRNGVEQTLKVGRSSSGGMTGTTFSATLATSTDQEVVIYNARHIKKIGNLSGVNPSVLNLVEAEKMCEIVCNNATLLTDVRISEKNKLLRKVDLSGCTKLGTSSGGGNTFDLSEAYSVQDVNLLNTALENITLPTEGCNLISLKIPSTLKILELRNMPLLSNVNGISSRKEFTRLVIVDCPMLDAKQFNNTNTEYIWIEHSFLPFNASDGVFRFGYLYNSYTPPDINTIVLKDLDCFKEATVHVAVTGSGNKAPKCRKFEVTGCDMKELKVYKIGLLDPQAVDLSSNKIGALLISGIANMTELILPESLAGFSFDYLANASTFGGPNSSTQFDKTIYADVHVAGKTTGDFSKLLITEYFRYLCDPEAGSIIINCDFTKGTGLGQTTRFYLSTVYKVEGKVVLDDSTNTLYSSDSASRNKLTEILLDLDTSHVTNFTRFFADFKLLESVPDIDTSNGTNFSYMFYNCSKLTAVPLLDTSNGTDFRYMFGGCYGLIAVPLLDTSNGTDFSHMFGGCSSLIDVPLLNTSNGTDFSYMFGDCSSLIDVPLLDTSNGTDFSYMLYDCS